MSVTTWKQPEVEAKIRDAVSIDEAWATVERLSDARPALGERGRARRRSTT